MKTLLILIAILIIWSVYGYFASRVEKADYVVTKELEDYEIRTYAAHIAAQTRVQGEYKDSLNNGFRIIAGYIFGGNTKRQSIAMTAPVTEQLTTSEKIAMTAPVQASIEGDSHIISFVMPRSYTLATLPRPNDTRVELVEVPSQTMAVIRFSGLRTDSRVLAMKTKLNEALSRDSITVVGSPIYAGYNAPFTPPWMTRNEVMVQVKYK